MPDEIRQYVPIPVYTDDEVRQILDAGDPETLDLVSISLSLYHEDRTFVESVLVGLARHPDPNVRGNAILGFGHLARRYRALDVKNAKPLIEMGLRDPDDYVRGQAVAAADDAAFFLGWTLNGHNK